MDINPVTCPYVTVILSINLGRSTHAGVTCSERVPEAWDVDKARDGDLAAIKLLFDRTLGHTPDPQLLDLQDFKERELAIAKQRAEAAMVMADAAEERALFSD